MALKNDFPTQQQSFVDCSETSKRGLSSIHGNYFLMLMEESCYSTNTFLWETFYSNELISFCQALFLWVFFSPCFWLFFLHLSLVNKSFQFLLQNFPCIHFFELHLSPALFSPLSLDLWVSSRLIFYLLKILLWSKTVGKSKAL